MFCVGVGVVILTPMPHIDMGTKPDNYIMFCVVMLTPGRWWLKTIVMTEYTKKSDVGVGVVGDGLRQLLWRSIGVVIFQYKTI